jgi:thiol-disulfide isomerase/thioredoxin
MQWLRLTSAAARTNAKISRTELRPLKVGDCAGACSPIPSAGAVRAVPLSIPRCAHKSWLVLIVLMLWLMLWPCGAVSAQVDQKVRRAPDFDGGDVWLDQGAPVPHHISQYRGQVVLIDFWEYTCINCIRDFGVLKTWYGKYHPYGLDIIGVHYGEFNIGFDVNNVREAAKRFRLPWPVVADQEGSAWKAYRAQGWPNRFLIDQKGDIVMSLFGETNNREMEDKIRDLLAKDHPEVTKIAPDPAENTFRPECGVTTQETYVGQLYGRGSVDDMDDHQIGDSANFVPPHSPPDGGVMLVGRWRVEHDGVTSEGKSDGAELRYHARSMYAVLSLSGAKQVRVDLYADGLPLRKQDAGADVQFDSKGAYLDVTTGRMYYIIRSPAFSGHLVSLEPEGSGLSLHSFTYGNNCQLADNP